MNSRHQRTRRTIIAALVGGVTLLHYSTAMSAHYYHIFYRDLYFVPLIFAAFWLGLRGALVTSLSITFLYLPFIAMHWGDFSPDDFSQLLQIGLYNAIAVCVGVARDRETREQERAREAERLAAMGKALSGVAHDMKTPLVAIGGFSVQIQRHLSLNPGKDEEYCRDKLKVIIKETRHLENLVKDMLDFARPLQLNRSCEDIHQIFNETISTIQILAEEKGLSIQNNAQARIPSVCLDPLRIRQVLLNLATNAVQASPEGETVQLSCHREGAELMIDVTDHGCGIPMEKRKEIYNPFFTTKKEGTGLGLSIVKKIVEAHEGHIEILDNPERGLTFRVVLPFLEECPA